MLLVRAVRQVTGRAGLAGMDVAEVCPPPGHAEVTATWAGRAVMEPVSALAATGHRTLAPLPAAAGQDGRRPPAWISRPDGS